MTIEAVRLTVDSDRLDGVEDVLRDLGAEAISVCDAGDHPIHEPAPGETPAWPVSVIEALFSGRVDRQAVLLGLLGSGLVGSVGQVEFAEIAGRDWERVWMDRFRPMQFGTGVWIYPSHLEPDPDWPVVVRLDPGLAFGTGTHPTTAMCLEWIDRRDLRGATVIDYGCGSGVLAIACALKGAGRVIAVDHDPQALAATRENARRNGVEARIEWYAPDTAPAVPAGLVLANILAGVLIDLAAELAGRVAPGGELVLSGILADQADEVAAAYTGRLAPVDCVMRDGWARLVFRRTQSHCGGSPNCSGSDSHMPRK